MNMETPHNSKTKIVSISVGVLVVIAIIFMVFDKKAPEANVAITETTNNVTPIDTTKSSVVLYKDGTYSATGSYMSPGGPDKVGVKLTLVGGVISDITVTPIAGDKVSEKFQAQFMSGYKTLVLGKKIDGLKLDKVSGSSLTPIGFNDALEQIKAQAKA